MQTSTVYLSDFAVQNSLGVEVTAASAGTLEIVVSFSGPSLTLRLSDVHMHVRLAECACTTQASDENTASSSTGT